MKTCLTKGELRAHLDGEFPAAARHLETCAGCRREADALAARASRVRALFADLTPDGPGTNAAAALARLEVRRRVPVLRWATASAMGAVATVAFLLFSVAKPPEPPPESAFLRLDQEEPIQMGVVLRVNVPAGDSGGVEADVVVGEDGRIRAVRLVK